VASFAAAPVRVTQSGGALRDSSPSGYEGDSFIVVWFNFQDTLLSFCKKKKGQCNDS